MRATKKLLDRVGPPDPDLDGDEEPGTLLRQWYATVLPWRPHVALFVNELTLLPILLPLAPSAGLLCRFPAHVATVLAEYGAPETVIDDERRRMRDIRVGKTINRSTTGIMNEFARLAPFYRDGDPELPELAARLAAVPCGPLYKRHIRPDREFAALVHSLGPASG